MSLGKEQMTRRSQENAFVVFPSKAMEREWARQRSASICPEDLAMEMEQVLADADDEQTVHDFFERHPQALPSVAFYHNGPRGGVIITKLPLGEDFVCDFAFASENSQMVQFTCIEIESPRKRLFNRGASFSRGYLDAKQQIVDWNCWAQQNIGKAMRLFDRLGDWLPRDYYQISLECILIMGRRAEISTLKRRQRWAAENALRQVSMHIMTYDRVLENLARGFHAWDKKMLVCHYRDRALHVKRIS